MLNWNSNNKKNSNFHIYVLFSYLKVWLLLNRILFVFYILFFFFQIKDDSWLMNQKSKHVITFYIRNIFLYIFLFFFWNILKIFRSNRIEFYRIRIHFLFHKSSYFILLYFNLREFFPIEKNYYIIR